jgi:hypothetical protein
VTAPLSPAERKAFDELMNGPGPSAWQRFLYYAHRSLVLLGLALLALVLAVLVFAGTAWLAYHFCVTVLDKLL